MTAFPPDFWETLETLCQRCRLVIDRPQGSHHPRFPEIVYPFDYGYLEGTTGGDGQGVDAWRGSRHAPTLDGVLITVDLDKQDAEIKLLVGCPPGDIAKIEAFHNAGNMRAWYVPRPGGLIA
jgi:inorganic pyrophosphatase